MRTRLRFAALALAGLMSFAASAHADTGDKSIGYCKITCVTASSGCAALGGGVEFCSGTLAGWLDGCAIQAAE